MVSTPSLSRLCSQAIGTYSASPRKPQPSGSRTPPNLVAMKTSLRFSGFNASHLPMISSESPCLQISHPFSSYIHQVLDIIRFLRRSHSSPKRCIPLHTHGQAGLDAPDQGSGQLCESMGSPVPWYRSRFEGPMGRPYPEAAL